MKNNLFIIQNNPIIQNNIKVTKGHKRSKSNNSILYNNSNINNLDELKIIEPIDNNNNKNKNNISKIINFKKNESILKNKNNKLNKSINIKATNKICKKNYNKHKKMNSKLNIDNQQKLINNIKNNDIFLTIKKNNNYHKKNNSFRLPNIHIINKNHKKNKSLSNKNFNKYKNKFNSILKIIPFNNKSIINKSEKITSKKKKKFKINKNINTSIINKENINTINICNSNSNRQNSISTDINSSISNRYSPNITFGNKQKKIKYIKIPQDFVYTKKIQKNYKNNEDKLEYNKFKNDLNKIIIDDISINDIDEKIEKKFRVSYFERFKTFEEIEKKNLNMITNKKIINRNLNIQTYNINEYETNENKLILNKHNDEENYNNIKTATFGLSEN